MDTTRADTSHAPQRDAPRSNAVNDLFDYDAGLDDILASIEPTAESNNNPDASGRQSGTANSGNAGLGLDEEIKVTKKRQPVAKLDEGRLLSQAGIPRLRKSAKKLKFKGKGHEYSDALRLLSFYQLWLDELYPRAKFADGLAMIEKLGHSKRIQIMRREWIDEGKPRSSSYSNAEFSAPNQTRTAAKDDTPDIGDTNLAGEHTGNPSTDGDMDIDLDNLGGPSRDSDHQFRSIFGGDRTGGRKGSSEQDNSLFVLDDENTQPRQTDNDDGDELDALLAEQDGAPNPKAAEPEEDNFDDDLEAMNMYEV